MAELSRIVLSVAFVIFAAALFRFSSAILSLNENIPALVDQVNATTAVIDSVNSEAVPAIVDQIDKIQNKIPLILAETRALREETIPPALNTANAFSNQIPFILNTVDSVNASLPKILQSVDSINQTAEEALELMDTLNGQIPGIMSLINTTNDSINSYLHQAEDLLSDADKTAAKLGKQATQGAIAGIVTTPFALGKGIGQSVQQFFAKRFKEISKSDAEFADYAVQNFLNKNSNARWATWTNPKTHHSGQIIVMKEYVARGHQVKQVRVVFTLLKRYQRFKG